MIQSTQNSTRFLDAFTALEEMLKKESQRNDVGFSTNVELVAKSNYYIRAHQTTLIEYAQLRNAIVHQRINYNEVIAEPHDEVVRKIEQMAAVVTSPKRISALLKQKKVHMAHVTDHFLTTLKIQVEQGFSVTPIYDNQSYCGLVDGSLTQRLLVKHQADLSVLGSFTCRDVLNLSCSMDRVLFVGADARVYDVLEQLNRKNKQGIKIHAIIVSEHGQSSEQCMGVMTSADIGLLHEVLYL